MANMNAGFMTTDVTYAQNQKEPGLIDQLTEIGGRLVDIGNALDSIADRVGGPMPRDLPAVSLNGATPQMNIAACVRTIRENLSRVEAETKRIGGSL